MTIDFTQFVMHSSFATPVLLAVVVIILSWSLTEFLWLRPKKIERSLRKQGLKGNPYKLVVGDAVELWRLTKEDHSLPCVNDDPLPGVIAFFDHIIQKYGKICFAWIMTQPCIIVTAPKYVKEILHKHEQFQKPNYLINKALLVGLIGLEGQQWAKRRKIINPAFHAIKLKNLFEVVYPSWCEMPRAWEDMLSDKQSVELDVWPFIERASADAISRAAFGTSYEEGRIIVELLKEYVDLLMQSQESNNIPGWRHIPTNNNKRLKHIEKEINALLTQLVDSRKKELEVGADDREDLLDILLGYNKNERKQDDDEISLKTKDVVEECKLFYLAGQETTSSLLVWTLVLLSKHRAWQDRAREEVIMVFGKDSKPDYDGLSRLKVVSMILYEVLRLYTPAFAIVRKIYNNMELGNILLPKGTALIIPLSTLHRDCELWGADANKFNPARFANGVAQATNVQGAFLPFGAGPRTCIGQNFSLLEVKLALVKILQLFDFDFAQSYVHAPSSLFTLKPQYGANLVLRRVLQ